jgi:uncharacterized repeat protein (TIGR01451 family)
MITPRAVTLLVTLAVCALSTALLGAVFMLASPRALATAGGIVLAAPSSEADAADTSLPRPRALPQAPAFAQPLLDAADASFSGADATRAGERLAMVGDVNGDGLDDVLIGAPAGVSVDGHTAPGRTYLVLGRREADWGPAFDLANADASFVGEQQLQYTSHDLAGVGDVNGDGFDDMLIGAFRNSPTESITHGGKAYLVLGNEQADWGPDFDLAQSDATFIGEAENDAVGWGLAAAGDVNGDGLDDMLIGACSGFGIQATSGKAYLVLGRAAADWGRDASLSAAEAVFLGRSANDYAGCAVAGATDVNGDGLDDMLIGAWGNDELGLAAGQTYLVLGRARADWGSGFDLGNSDASFVGAADSIRSGYAVAAAGDVNHDGLGDFVIGAPRGGDNAGEAYLVLGRADADWGIRASLADADASFIGAEAEDEAGYAVSAAGDVNGDGFDDFLIGALAFDASPVATNTGRTYLVLGRSDGWSRGRDLAGADAATDLVAFDGELVEDWSGSRTAGGGDVDGDGLGDFVIGAPGHYVTEWILGKAYLILGRGLRLEKRSTAPAVAPGERVTYELFYTNTTRSEIRAVRLVDRLPQSLSFSGCFGGLNCGEQDGLVLWQLGDVPSGGGGMLLLQADLAQSGAGVRPGARITNTAWITAPVMVNPVASRWIMRVAAPTPTGTRSPSATHTPTPQQGTGSPTSTSPVLSPTVSATPNLETAVAATLTALAPEATPTGGTGDGATVYLPVARRGQ